MDADRLTRGVRLSRVLPRSRFFQADDILATACCADYQQCRAGDVYVALVEAERDGHDYAYDAISRGASAIVTERLLPVDVPQCLVQDSRVAFGQLCHQLAGSPSENLHVIGVAGHYGKSATQMLTAAVLENAGLRPAVYGSLGYSDGIDACPTAHGDANAARYAHWLAEAVANVCSHAVVEMPAPQVARRRFAGMTTDVTIITELATASHRGSLSPKARSYLNRVLGRLKASGMIVANTDCPIVRQLVKEVDRPVLTIGMQEPADLTATVLEEFPSEQTFLLQAGGDTAVVRTKIIGMSHVRSALLAAAAGLSMNIDLQTIVRGLESIETMPGRLERVECGQSFDVFIDGAPTPAALSRALRTLRSVTPGRIICVLGEGHADMVDVRSQRGRVAERYADMTVITSDDPADPRPLQAAHDLLDGFHHPGKAQVMPNRVNAIAWALQQARPDDIVLIAGPHNRQLVRSPQDYVPDADVVRYCLMDKAEESADWLNV